jgi:hypothetical protein
LEVIQVDVLGVDIGGVIIDRVNDGTDTSFFGDNYLATTPTPGVFDALARLVNEKFGEHAYVVSKCGQRTQDRSVEWLAHHRFSERTGISLDRVRFCRERSGKAPIAAALGLTHFVDDKLEVLSYLTTVRNLYLYRPQAKEVQRYQRYRHLVREMHEWEAIADSILLAT